MIGVVFLFTVLLKVVSAQYICDKDPNPSHLDEFCQNCKWSNQMGYTNFPSDCSKYIVCIRNGNPPFEFTTFILYCPKGTFWSNEKLACTIDVPSKEKCEFHGSNRPIPTSRPCQLFPGPHPKTFLQNGIQRTCPGGTEFVAKKCACLTLKPRKCGDLVLYVPYDKDFNDRSCNRAHADVIGRVTLSTTNFYKGRASAYFSGQGFLQYGLLSNYYNMKNIKEWTVSLFLYTSGTPGIEGIVSQADSTTLACKSPFEIFLGHSIHVRVNSEIGTATAYATSTTNNWIHIVLRYNANSSKTDLFIGGKIVATSNLASGALINSKCPLTVGWRGKDYKKGLLNGYIDELKIFSRSLIDAEILALSHQNN